MSIINHTKREDIETLNPYGYTGREIETDELYYYRARYYDAGTQRFISLDPIGFMSGDFNFYRYVGNSPVGFVDPFGLAPNQGGATSPSTVTEELKVYEAQGLDFKESMEALSNNHGGGKDRYFHTNEYGWVDIRHFGKAAAMGSDIGNFWTEVLGVGNEIVQYCTEKWNEASYESGFSPEDIPSNAAGARFGDNANLENNASDEFEDWLDKVGGNEINDKEAGFTTLPKTDPAINDVNGTRGSTFGSQGVVDNNSLGDDILNSADDGLNSVNESLPTPEYHHTGVPLWLMQ